MMPPASGLSTRFSPIVNRNPIHRNNTNCTLFVLIKYMGRFAIGYPNTPSEQDVVLTYVAASDNDTLYTWGVSKTTKYDDVILE